MVDDPWTTAPNSPRGVHRCDERGEGVTSDGGLGSGRDGGSARGWLTGEGGAGGGEGATGAASASAIVRGGRTRVPPGCVCRTVHCRHRRNNKVRSDEKEAFHPLRDTPA